ncbi:MAG: hypothetical protein A2099_04340 [Planctomycetes bacterium GWF2_39_10]|nr:MAG: hypothetical protein A2Y09_04090 [Planctomycetes bacterium GWA2_39_15]OHB50151.1 MAG: hypothetical protein A2099_04340 [Planctomycetes bacterium GWF2_39_10]
MAFILLVFGILLMTFKSMATEIIANETIVTMVKAGLGEELIISKIQASQSQFDVSTETILKLKKEGVSERIIKAMLDAPMKANISDDKASPGIEPMAAFLGLPSITKSIEPFSMYVKHSNKVQEMLRSFPEYAHSMKKHTIPFYFGPGDTWRYIRGEKSIIRVSGKCVFYTKENPQTFVLVKLDYQKAKNIRFAVETGGLYKNTIPFKFQEKPGSFFEMSPAKELEKGEYAFIQTMGFYDFGIE